VPVVALKPASSYACRNRNGQSGAKKSEHAFANALDIAAFQLADGRVISVLRGWRGSAEEQVFLRQAYSSACSYFTTVLGPGSDRFHHDHFHIDLARHDARGARRVCKPRPESVSLPTAYAPIPAEAEYLDR
jgi:hypothetical protein